jgi:hypothetical protein
MKTKILSLFIFLCCISSLSGQEKEYTAYLVATAHFDTQLNYVLGYYRQQ